MDDKSLQHAVAEELEWARHVDASQIEVVVHEGVVQLRGSVATLAEKKAANRSVWHLHGVRGVRDDIEVRPSAAHQRSDEEIASRARQVMLWDSLIPASKIGIQVKNGVVTLTGTLDLPHQRAEAEQRIQHLAGVVQVNNQIILNETSKIEADLHTAVSRALKRHSELDAVNIVVEVHENQVRLTGTVSSYIQRRIAENAAWAAPGVNDVVDLLHVVR
jgi:osmotically-inducible protein OsmY